jgi:hypothetical protein
MSANISIKTDDDQAIKLAGLVAENLENEKSGRDFGEITAEDAYQDAITSVARAIRDAIRTIKNPSEG